MGDEVIDLADEFFDRQVMLQVGDLDGALVGDPLPALRLRLRASLKLAGKAAKAFHSPSTRASISSVLGVALFLSSLEATA